MIIGRAYLTALLFTTLGSQLLYGGNEPFNKKYGSEEYAEIYNRFRECATPQILKNAQKKTLPKKEKSITLARIEKVKKLNQEINEILFRQNTSLLMLRKETLALVEKDTDYFNPDQLQEFASLQQEKIIPFLENPLVQSFVRAHRPASKKQLRYTVKTIYKQNLISLIQQTINRLLQQPYEQEQKLRAVYVTLSQLLEYNDPIPRHITETTGYATLVRSYLMVGDKLKEIEITKLKEIEITKEKDKKQKTELEAKELEAKRKREFNDKLKNILQHKLQHIENLNQQELQAKKREFEEKEKEAKRKREFPDKLKNILQHRLHTIENRNQRELQAKKREFTIKLTSILKGKLATIKHKESVEAYYKSTNNSSFSSSSSSSIPGHISLDPIQEESESSSIDHEDKQEANILFDLAIPTNNPLTINPSPSSLSPNIVENYNPSNWDQQYGPDEATELQPIGDASHKKDKVVVAMFDDNDEDDISVHSDHSTASEPLPEKNSVPELQHSDSTPRDFKPDSKSVDTEQGRSASWYTFWVSHRKK